MIKQEIINILSEAREIHSKWLDNGHILVESINVDNVEEPVNCYDCEFSKRLTTDGESFSEQSWYKELQIVHEDLHKAYSALYYESHRMYNPKTLEELMELFVLLESHAKMFSLKLNEIETEFELMSDQEYQDILDNFKTMEPKKAESIDEKDAESVQLVVSDPEEPLEMEVIDIEKPDEDEFQLMEFDTEANEEIETAEEDTQTEYEDVDSSEISFEQNDVAQPIEFKHMAQSTNKISSGNIKQYITLKKQDILQLIEEKELSQLELTHLEEREKLTQKSVDQIEQHFVLKKQEIETENLENDQLVKFKTKERQQTNEQMAKIETKKAEINKLIEDLKSQNEKDALELKEDQKLINIKKQFDELKLHKTVDLEKLATHLQNKEDEVKNIKEQLSELEQEVAEIKEDISKKDHDLEDICEKEKLKNEERELQIAEQGKITQKRLDTIDDRQKEIDELDEQTQAKESELEVIDFQIEDLDKNSVQQSRNNEVELAEFIKQQDMKRQKLNDTSKLKDSKQQEIDEIDRRIDDAERSLSELQTSAEQSEQTEEDQEDLVIAD